MHLIDKYFEYTSINTTSRKFALWSMLATISAALERRVWLDNGNFGYLYPNIYTILVGKMASGKSQAIKQASGFLKRIPLDADPGPRFSPAQITPAALIQEFANNCKILQVGKRRIPHSPLFVCASELARFFKDFGGGSILMELMDYYDSPGTNAPETYTIQKRTKKDGYETIKNPSLTLLAGSTPSYLSEEIQRAKAGLMGLDSRILFVVDTKFYPKLVDYKVGSPSLEMDIIHCLHRIYSLKGPMSFTHEAKNLYKNFIEDLNEQLTRLYGRESLQESYLSRKDTNVMKVAMCVSAARGSDLKISKDDLERTLEYFKGLEANLAHAYQPQSIHKDLRLSEIISRYIPMSPEWISESELLEQIRSEMGVAIHSTMEYNGAIEYLIKSRRIIRSTDEVGRKFSRMK